MTPAIPVIDLDAAEAGDRSQLDAVRAATEELGAVQVVNHGVPQDLIADLNARMDRLLSLPRAEKAELASPHPYRGWRQWPDDFGRLELERFNVAQFDDIGDARAAGLGEDYLGLYAHANVWPEDDPGLRDAASGYIEASRRLATRMLGLYARAQGLRGDTFGLGDLPHLRLTVNDYPTWTYPEATADEDKLLLLEHAGGGLPVRVRPPRADRRLARRPALRRRAGRELTWPVGTNSGWTHSRSSSSRPCSSRAYDSWPTSSPGASSTGTCGGCARSTGAAAMPCWPRWPGGCPGCGRPAYPLGCTWSPGCRRTWTRPRWSTRPRAGVGIEGVTPYRISHPGPGGLIFGYATVNEQAIAEGIDILARVISEP